MLNIQYNIFTYLFNYIAERWIMDVMTIPVAGVALLNEHTVSLHLAKLTVAYEINNDVWNKVNR